MHQIFIIKHHKKAKQNSFKLDPRGILELFLECHTSCQYHPVTCTTTVNRRWEIHVDQWMVNTESYLACLEDWVGGLSVMNLFRLLRDGKQTKKTNFKASYNMQSIGNNFLFLLIFRSQNLWIKSNSNTPPKFPFNQIHKPQANAV